MVCCGAIWGDLIARGPYPQYTFRYVKLRVFSVGLKVPRKGRNTTIGIGAIERRQGGGVGIWGCMLVGPDGGNAYYFWEFLYVTLLSVSHNVVMRRHRDASWKLWGGLQAPPVLYRLADFRVFVVIHSFGLSD